MDLAPRRHAPPAGWTAELFESLTDALAAALVAAVLRADAAAGSATTHQKEEAR